jgi:hypothetical protein
MIQKYNFGQGKEIKLGLVKITLMRFGIGKMLFKHIQSQNSA